MNVINETKTKIFMVKLGELVKDKITGFSGIAISQHLYLTGCNQFGVQPRELNNGAIQESKWFDEGRLEKIGDGITANEVAGATGGPERERP